MGLKPADGAPRPKRQRTSLSGKRLRVVDQVFRSGNPRVPHTHGWLAFEVLRRAAGGTLLFEEYERRLFHSAPEIGVVARIVTGPHDGIVRLMRLDPKHLQSRTIRLHVDATRPGRRLGRL